jgi:nucleotide-binding universal stress UspA family protein
VSNQINRLIGTLLGSAVRWHGLIGGGIGGAVTSVAYSMTGDKISLALTSVVVCLFCLGGFMLGLFFERYTPDNYGNVHSMRFIATCSVAGAIVVAILSASGAKFLTDDCFAAVRAGKSAVENCRFFAGNAVLVIGGEILAVSVSAGCFCIQMRRRHRPWIKSLITASLIASFVACGFVVLLDTLDIGTRYFDINKYPDVNPHTVLVGGAILGSAMGLLIGLHAALMIAFAPEPQTKILPELSESSGEVQFDVFLSHNSKDKDTVRRLAEAMTARGLKVWLDEWELVPGRPWQEALEKIIQTTKAAAVLIGADGLGPWEIPEMRGCLSEFVERQLPVIPVLLPDAPKKPELPLFLKQFTWVDLRGGINRKSLDKLEWGVRGLKPGQVRRPVIGQKP